MRIIRTQLHGLIDYLFALVLLLPLITGHGTTGKDTIVFTILGLAIITMSMITDYEFGLIKLIPMKVHLLIDLIISFFIIAMPILFPLENYYLYWPVILGVTGVLVTILSSSRPYVRKKDDKDITKPYH
jgi:hypothetical protein